MTDVLLTRELIAQGYTADEINQRRRSYEVARVRRGAYVVAGQADQEPAERHRTLIEATVPQLTSDAVISHTSAAVLHGLPVWSQDLGPVHLTRPRTGGGGKNRHLVRMHTQPLAEPDVSTVDGLAVTSLERTIFDLSRTLPFERAVAAGDQALALGMALDLLTEMVDRGRRWHGITRAKRVAGFIDGRAESAGESVSRVRCFEARLPPPTPQLPVVLPYGRTVFGDLGWEEFRTIGEFDGLIKYEKLLRRGEKAADVVVREKRREDVLRALGWQIVRWIWEDLWNFGPVHQALLAAFERGRRYATVS